MSMALQPSLKSHDAEYPAASQAGDGDGDVQKHHHVVVSSAHRRDGHLLRGEHEHQTTTREEERCERLGWWARGEDRTRRSEPEEEVGEASEDGECSEEVTPKHVDLDLEQIGLGMSSHGSASDADAQRREGVEGCDVTWRFRNSFLRSRCLGDGSSGP